MVVMGIAGKSKLEKAIIGSNAVDVSQNSYYPVLIVPSEASLQSIRKILFACDLTNVSTSTPVGLLKEFLHLFNGQLFVLNVDSKNRKSSPHTPKEISQLHDILDKYKPEYAIISHENTSKGILEYAEKNQVSLIITIPKNYNFFQKLFHKSISENLIYHSAIPLLTLHK
jgi:nucleotide-binding universal stress UspA family protein